MNDRAEDAAVQMNHAMKAMGIEKLSRYEEHKLFDHAMFNRAASVGERMLQNTDGDAGEGSHRGGEPTSAAEQGRHQSNQTHQEVGTRGLRQEHGKH
jgi:hypothetical protein